MNWKKISLSISSVLISALSVYGQGPPQGTKGVPEFSTYGIIFGILIIGLIIYLIIKNKK